MKKTILVVYGGNTSEHDISIISAVMVMRSMPSKGYKCVPVYLRDGIAYTGSKLFELKSYINFNPALYDKIEIIKNGIYTYCRSGKLKKVNVVDCALLATHGGDGENGVLQGFLQTHRIPHSSSDVRACAICMDKQLTKLVASSIGVNVVAGLVINGIKEYNRESIIAELGFPIIVKPVSQGSSIGITVANSQSELDDATNLALCFGDRVLYERQLSNFVELNIAAVKLAGDIMISEIEEPVSQSDFLTFSDKYLSQVNDKLSISRKCQTTLDPEIRNHLIETTKLLYEKIGLFGIARFDYLLSDNVLYLNEINAIPGNLAMNLFKQMSRSELLTAVIDASIMRGVPLAPRYESVVLENLKEIKK
ncbi:MAG: hypothetical protein LBE09_08175 [Christensenellaceae bacterium]|jgi:D-alanine-D-alanine ligase|nr:hypothetical protein [Christensenellaceae bacterium]